MDDNRSGTAVVGWIVAALFQAALIFLKLVNAIDVSWWVILTPTWVLIALMVGIVIAVIKSFHSKF